jgi:8-oxo-dGTP pyrophosphatase MutT (NUDIX family)
MNHVSSSPDSDCARAVRVLQKSFEAYAKQSPEAKIGPFLDFLEEAPACFDRGNREGHFTGSAWLVSGDGKRVLLTHHKKLDRWLQLGGHADGEADLANVALREAEEESGLFDLAGHGEPFDLDRHRIPARGENEPEHWHYDVRYVVWAGADERFIISDESHGLAWRSIEAMANDPDSDASLKRMAQKWLNRPKDSWCTPIALEEARRVQKIAKATVEKLTVVTGVGIAWRHGAYAVKVHLRDGPMAGLPASIEGVPITYAQVGVATAHLGESPSP